MGFANLAVAEVSKKDPFDSERRVIIVGGFEECVKAQNAVRSWGFLFLKRCWIGQWNFKVGPY